MLKVTSQVATPGAESAVFDCLLESLDLPIQCGTYSGALERN